MKIKQEIREGIKELLRATAYIPYCDCKECERHGDLTSKQILAYLHSKGVVGKALLDDYD